MVPTILGPFEHWLLQIEGLDLESIITARGTTKTPCSISLSAVKGQCGEKGNAERWASCELRGALSGWYNETR